MGYKFQKPGNSKTKRARHQCEKYWNRYAEPFVRFLGGKFHTSDTWLKRKYDPIVEIKANTY